MYKCSKERMVLSELIAITDGWTDGQINLIDITFNCLYIIAYLTSTYQKPHKKCPKSKFTEVLFVYIPIVLYLRQYWSEGGVLILAPDPSPAPRLKKIHFKIKWGKRTLWQEGEQWGRNGD